LGGGVKLQYASFLLPLHYESDEQETLNRFLRGHSVNHIRKELVNIEGVSRWALLIEYLENAAKPEGGGIKNKIDYKDVLSAEDFSLFSKLRDARKKIADEQGVKLFVVCTNEQLAAMATQKPRTKDAFKQIEGFGEAKTAKYAEPFLKIIAELKMQTNIPVKETEENNGAFVF
jgi:superfamily II DNA helicase RecQ